MGKRVDENRKIATFESLAAIRTFEVDLTIPGMEPQVLQFRIPTVSEVWQLLREMPEEPIPPISGREPFKDGVKNIYNTRDPEYLEAFEDWNREASTRQVLLTWGHNLEGDTPEEKKASLEGLGAIAGAALRGGARMAIQLGEGALGARSFRGS